MRRPAAPGAARSGHGDRRVDPGPESGQGIRCPAMTRIPGGPGAAATGVLDDDTGRSDYGHPAGRRGG
eukprot:761120-Hanusia_phi.AAC.3